MKNRITILVLLFSFLVGCSSTNFMGAVSYKQGPYYTERWYINPDYNVTLPTGTAGYGASAEKLKDKFIIKYYISDEDGSNIEIPRKNMWLITNTSNNLFCYLQKNALVKYKISHQANLLAIKECDKNGWCKLYEQYDIEGKMHNIYVKKSILLKRLTDE